MLERLNSKVQLMELLTQTSSLLVKKSTKAGTHTTSEEMNLNTDSTESMEMLGLLALLES